MRASCGGQQSFDDAVARGDVWEVIDPDTGKSLWYDNEEEDYEDTGVNDTTSVNMGKKDLTNDTAVALRGVPIIARALTIKMNINK